MSAAPLPPGLIRVVEVNEPLIGLRRVTFEGQRLAAFTEGCGAAHIKLFFSPDGDGPPELPTVNADGKRVWPLRRPVVRTYSVRRFDAQSRRLEVDFVLHEAPGPASDWARRAQVGQQIGVAGPALPPVLARPATWNLFAGDLSALPMISARIEALPRGSQAWVALEMPQVQLVEFDTHARVSILQTAASSTRGLLDMVRGAPWPRERTVEACRVCAAGESTAMVDLRRYLVEEVGLSKSQLYTVPFWKRNATEELYHQERHRLMDSMEAA